MKKAFCLVLSIIFSLNLTLTASTPMKIHPRPQFIETENREIDLPKSIKLITEATTNSIVLSKLKTIFPDTSAGDYQLILGKKGDTTISKFEKHIPNQKEGYYLSTTDKEIVLAGNDDRGLYYGLLTLSQIINDNKLTIVEITDYPDVAFRGVVEGFYGTPWSIDARLSQLQFYGEMKLNTYIFGPKNDPYHRSPHWREAYPEKQVEDIKQLVKKADENMVNFVWAIHPGLDIQWNDNDRDALIRKLSLMYDLGVRSFAVFFDDITGEGSKAGKQAELLNYIDTNFIQKREKTTPLILCPTEYNKSWANIEKGYLPTLGKELNPDINIMWTGDKVCIDITDESLDWVNPYMQRPAYIWWNFPVTDYVRDHLLMGPVYGNTNNIKGKVSGFVANPMEHAEASKIAIYSVADYTWNPEHYDANKAWEAAIKYLFPKNHDAFRSFAKHNSDTGPNGHQYRKDESVEIAPRLEKLLADIKLNKNNEQEYVLVKQEFDKIVEDMDILIRERENPALIKEIEAWILQLKTLGQIASASLEMTKAENKSSFISFHTTVESLRKQEEKLNETYNPNNSQPGAKVATLRLAPFVDEVFEITVKRFNEKYGTELNSESSYNPHQLVTNIGQLKGLQLRLTANKINLPPILEYLKWKKGQYIKLNLSKPHITKKIVIQLNDPAYKDWLRIDVTDNTGKTWTLENYQQIDNDLIIDLENISMDNIRFTNTKEDKELKLDELSIEILK